MRYLKMFVLTALILPSACQESKDFKEPVSEATMYSRIGEEIPMGTALEWIAKHDEQSISSGKEMSTPYKISGEALEAMLESVSVLVGVAFHYAIDDSGVQHIVAIPIDESMKLWPTIQGRILIDANSSSQISTHQARRWANNYRVANPDGIWYHFFGKTIFDEMRALPYFQNVDIAQGIHTSELTPEMLLIIWNNRGQATGRALNGPGTAYDASNPCPPCLVDDDDDDL